MPLHIQPPDPYPDVPFTWKKKNKANEKIAANLLPDPDRSPSPPPNIFREDPDPNQGGNDPNSTTSPPQDNDVLDEFAEFGGNIPTTASTSAEYDDINTMSDSRWKLFLDDTDIGDPNSTSFFSCSGSNLASASFHSARSSISDIDELPSLDRLQSIHQDHGSDDEEVVFAIRRGISNDHEDAKLAEEIDGMIHKNRKLWP